MRIAIGLVLTCISIASLGCGGADPKAPKLYTVSGTVTWDGQPLKDAAMVFRSSDGKNSAGATVTDGKFTAKLVAGTSNVQVNSLVDSPDGKFKEENPGQRVPVKVELIPKKYNSETTLKIDVKGDTKDAKFDLTK